MIALASGGAAVAMLLGIVAVFVGNWWRNRRR
jgi:hypothetical protein